jgi:cytochrome c2
MNCIRNVILGFIIVVQLVPLLAQKKAAHPNGNRRENRAAPESKAEIARGQRAFQQNCSRCHNAPQGFPPQISATILRHMRVRASLSAADERALLRFMNP